MASRSALQYPGRREGLPGFHAGGHRCRRSQRGPNRNNPIVRLSAALARLGAYNFKVAINPVTRGYFEAMSGLVAPAKWRRTCEPFLPIPRTRRPCSDCGQPIPRWNSVLRTTCVVTEIEGGHAENALPQRVTGDRQLPHPSRRSHCGCAGGDQVGPRGRNHQRRGDRRAGAPVQSAAPVGGNHGSGAEGRRTESGREYRWCRR